MGKYREFIPIAVAVIIVALCALIPLAVGTGNGDGLGDVRSATADLAVVSYESQQSQGAQQALQVQGQAAQQELTQAIVAARKDGASIKQIAAAIVPIFGPTLTQQAAEQGVTQILQQAKAAVTQATPAPAPKKKG